MIILLKWERGGFVLFFKRLERGTFRSPEINDLTPEEEVIEVIKKKAKRRSISKD